MIPVTRETKVFRRNKDGQYTELSQKQRQQFWSYLIDKHTSRLPFQEQLPQPMPPINNQIQNENPNKFKMEN